MTHIVKLGNVNWPAWQKEEGVLVDLRLWPAGEAEAITDTLVYLPEKLAEYRIPAEIITAAAASVPPGFVLLGK